MPDKKTRAEVIADGLDKLAAWLRANRDMPVSPVTVYVFADTNVEFRQATLALPNPRTKHIPENDGYVWADHYFSGLVDVQVCVPKLQVCARRQVATRTVPASAEREEPVYEWDCEPLDLLTGDGDA